MTDPSVLDYAQFASRVYDDPPQFGAADGPARARMYGDVLAFRGTDDIATWLADFDISTTPVSGLGSVHAGFWGALAGILPALLAQSTPAAISAHSEGAALASFYAGVLCVLNRPPAAVYGFEPPRMCADNTLAELFRAKGIMLFYTSNGSDPVPLVPPELSIPGPLSLIGAPRGPIPDIQDHLISNVIASLRGEKLAE